MSFRPQSISGSSGSGGSGDFSSFIYVAAPGAVYEMSRWTGYTLRHLSFSFANAVSIYLLGGIYITNKLPTSLHPKDMDPQAFWSIYVYPGEMGGTFQFNFDPGLIWVGPGEILYIVVCDLVGLSSSSTNSARWRLNTLWEPYER